MGSLTAAQIVDQGLTMAGDPSLDAYGLTQLQAWLDKAYASHSWSFLRSTFGPIAVANGSSYVDFGNNTASRNLRILAIERVMLADALNNGFKGDLFISGDAQTGPEDYPMWLDTSATGTPYRANVDIKDDTSPYVWRISFNTVTNKAFQIGVRARYLPGVLGSLSIPLYPHDETMIQAVYVAALRNMEEHARAMLEQRLLDSMLAQDKVIFYPDRTGRVLGLARHRYSRRKWSL